MSYIIGYILIGILFSTIAHLADYDRDSDHYMLVFLSGIVWWLWATMGILIVFFVGIPWLIGKAFKK